MTTENIILLAVLVLLLVLYPVLMITRNRKEQNKQRDLIGSLKQGDYVVTYSGIFGKIVEITEKEIGKFIVIETGETKKNYVTVSENAIYVITNNNPKIYDAEGNVIENEPSAQVEETKELEAEMKAENASEPVKTHARKSAKSSAKKSAK